MFDSQTFRRLRYLQQAQITTGRTEPHVLEYASIPEAVAFVADEAWTSRPKTASRVVMRFIQELVAALDKKERQRFMLFIPFLLESKGSEEEEQRRAWRIIDWQFRFVLPQWLRLAQLKVLAEGFEAAQPITDHDSLQAVMAKYAEVQRHVNELFIWSITPSVERIVQRSGSAAVCEAIEHLRLDPKLYEMKYLLMQLAESFYQSRLGSDEVKKDCLTVVMFTVRESAEDLILSLTLPH